jgi:hypothetical protein
MAAISLSISRGTSDSDFATGAQSVTVGANAPAAGDVEVRFSSASLAAGLTTREANELMGLLWQFIIKANIQDAAALWPNV